MLNAPESVIPYHFLFLNVVKASDECRVNADQEAMGLGMAWNKSWGAVGKREK